MGSHTRELDNLITWDKQPTDEERDCDPDEDKRSLVERRRLRTLSDSLPRLSASRLALPSLVLTS